MPTGSLPAEGKKIWERVYDQSKADGDSQETAAQKAWGAVKNAGWHKTQDGWVKSADLQEFSLTIRKATTVNGEMRWRADTSDIDSDLYDDNMSLELFSDFVERINREDLPPEPIREHYVSSYWQGGMPYLSLSHYSDLDGSAVPGVVDSLFVDGKFLKAKGRLYDTPLGKATWAALRNDLEKRSDTGHNPVRISIAFLDYQHRHKDTGTVFTRSFTDQENMVCRECLENAKKNKVGGKVFLKGLLIHLAMTRVPVNQRTIMEVERAMTTRKEDAESIVGEDLAAEINAKSLEVGKADLDDLVVTRSEEDTEETPVEVPNPSAAPDLSAILNAMTMLSQTVTTLAEEVRAMKAGKGANCETEDAPDDEEEDAKEKKMKSDAEVTESTVVEPAVDLVVALSEAMAPTNQRLDMLITALSQKPIPANAVPERRSLSAASVQQVQPGTIPNPGGPIKIGDFVRRSINGQ